MARAGAITYDAFGRRVGKALLGGPTTRRVDYVWQGTSLAEAWHRSGAGEGDEALSIERWHFEPDGLRPLAKELVPAGVDAEPIPAVAQWLPIVADQLGAPHALFGEDGQCQWRAEPELWGRTRTARAVLRERGGEAGGEGRTSPCALRFPGNGRMRKAGCTITSTAIMIPNRPVSVPRPDRRRWRPADPCLCA